MDALFTAQRAGCHSSTINRLIREGHIRARKVDMREGQFKYDVLDSVEDVRAAVELYAPKSGYKMKGKAALQPSLPVATPPPVHGSGATNGHANGEVLSPIPPPVARIDLAALRQDAAWNAVPLEKRAVLLALSQCSVADLQGVVDHYLTVASA